MPKLTLDAAGTPGILAANVAEAHAGIGYLHGRYRPLQSLLLHAAGRGVLSECLAPKQAAVGLDLLARRFDFPGRGIAEAERLETDVRQHLDAYLFGFTRGLREGGQPFELRALLARLPEPNHASVASALLFSAYAGASQGQERMERALLDALAEGAEPTLLEAMFAPHLSGWDPARLARLPRAKSPGAPSFGLAGGGGSNAWAVDGNRTVSGAPIVCGDPHLQVNQMPALLFEVRARVADDYWLGATIPGLPGIAVGRNRHVAWSGTFAVADNVDFVIETLDGGQLMRPSGAHPPVVREVEVRRRFRSPLRLSFLASEHGVLDGTADGDVLAVSWAGADRAAETLAAYLELPTARDAAHAELILDRAHTFSLHWVIADRGGDVRYRQAGRVPRRDGGWSGLYPVPADGPARWRGFIEGAEMPRAASIDGIVASANEARPAADGTILSTLAQPPYRLERIDSLLRPRRDLDRAAMQEIQLDLTSTQAPRLLPRLRQLLPDGPVRRALDGWNASYDADSLGAHAFEQARTAAIRALAPELGNGWWTTMLEQSELGIWWGAGLDRLLFDPAAWQGERGERMRAGVAAIARAEVSRWGDVQRLEMQHMVLGGLPGWFGFDRGPYALPGCRATVRQGYVVQIDGQPVATAPAFRMIAELDSDELWTALPGGIDGSRFAPSYDCWLDEWLDGGYHCLAPPDESETAA